MGAKIRVPQLESQNGELIGEIQVEHSTLQGGVIEGALTAAVIDEIPVLAVLGAATEEGLTIKDAGELRIKETDRIATVVDNLRRLGVAAEELPDGLVIPGRQKFRAAEFDSFGDHRIAMAFAVAALRGDGESVIHNADAASVSFPGILEHAGAGVELDHIAYFQTLNYTCVHGHACCFACGPGSSAGAVTDL